MEDILPVTKTVRELTKKEKTIADIMINDIYIDCNLLLQCPLQLMSYLHFPKDLNIDEDVKRYVSYHAYYKLNEKIKIYWSSDTNVRLEIN